LIPPFHFIPIAESSGLIGPLGRWALEQACSDAAGFAGLAADLDVAVNLSVRQLTQPDVVTHVRDALARSGLAPHRLVLEVTESAVMEDAESAAAALDALADLGVRIAVDDFGTGYSSLLYLRRYPITILKLDRAFVSGIDRSRDDEAICRSVISLAHEVNATSDRRPRSTRQLLHVLRRCTRLVPRCIPSPRTSIALSRATRRAVGGPPMPWRATSPWPNRTASPET
jgi:EAL domain-containing protein (putative c-di-GMP-specific phosphodiesterase class I)